MKSDRLIPDPPAGLRERRRADGTTRIWWEPSAAARALGFAAVELDETRLTWSRRQADRLNAELDRAQRAGRRETPRGSSRTIEALIEDLRRSVSWTDDITEKTRQSYNALFRQIIEKWGNHQVREFTKPVMHTWYQTLYRTKGEHMSVALLRAMSRVMSHAELIGWRPEGSNPCFRLKMKTPKGRARAATWPEIDALIAAADRIGQPSIGTAVMLSLFQGQRETDVYMATCGAFQDRITRAGGQSRARVQWTFTRSKRRNAGAMWLHDEVAPRVRALIKGAPADRRLLRDEKTGGDYTEELFIRRWVAVRDAAVQADRAGRLRGLAGLQFRDLRRTFGILSRSGGSTKDDTGDVLGNSSAVNPQLAEVYMPSQLDTASRAVDAIQRPGRKGRS
ncbi:hypothetical protein [Paracoccus sp. (in: a-proteobacteria)]|uniref:hypothetical protein n=1 Tax=Paracoccus sp. TaxID=267 RepID=UPI0035AEF09B